MTNSGPHGLLPTEKREQWRTYVSEKRRTRRTRAHHAEHVPIAVLQRSDGSEGVLVVRDEVLVPEDRRDSSSYRALQQQCEDVTRARERANRGYRRLRVSDSVNAWTTLSEESRTDAIPAALAVVAGTIKGWPTAENADAAPPPLQRRDCDRPPLVIVIDTGIDAATVSGRGPCDRQRSDAWLDRFELAHGNACHLDPLDVFAPFGGLDLGAGHGTFVAGMIAQVSGAANIRMIRAFDSDGFASDEMVADAIQQAGDMFEDETDGRGVLNLSFGIETVDGSEPRIVRAALDDLPDDVVAVAAAGNVASKVPFWPAASQRVLGVAALDRHGDLSPAPWSNLGDWVDFSTRGSGLVGPFVAGTETKGSGDPDDPFDVEPDDFPGPDAFATWEGTSFAAAQVSGRVAELLADEPTLSRDEITTRLQGMGTPSDGHGYRLSIL